MSKFHLYILIICMMLSIQLNPSTTYADELYIQPYVDLSIITLSSGILGGIHLGQATYDTQLHTRSTNPKVSSIDQIAPRVLNQSAKAASDYLLYAGLGVSIGTQLYIGQNQWIEHLILFAEVNAVNGLLTELSKYSIRRPRPYTRTTGVQEIDDELSFFSGHTSFMAALSFSTVQIINIKKKLSSWQKFWLYTSAVTLSSAMGILRVQAGKHYPTDVIVGGVVGGSLGILIPELHRKSKIRLSAQQIEQGASIVLYTSW